MTDLQPDKIGYYGKPITSLEKDELLQVVVKLAEMIINCPAKGKCSEVLKPIGD